MKLTWFAGTTFRIQIGGQVLVCDPEGAPAGVDPAELVSGADRVFALRSAGTLPAVDPAAWRRRRPQAPIDGTPEDPVSIAQFHGHVLVDAIGEPPLLLGIDELAGGARWMQDAVMVAAGEGGLLARMAGQALRLAGPRLIALAGPEADVDAVFAALRDELGDTGLVALEPGLALEV